MIHYIPVKIQRLQKYASDCASEKKGNMAFGTKCLAEVLTELSRNSKSFHVSMVQYFPDKWGQFKKKKKLSPCHSLYKYSKKHKTLLTIVLGT